MDEIKQEWVDEFRPAKLDDYVLDENIKSYFRDMINSNSLQNFSVVGTQGSGKTTLVRLLCNEFNAEVLFVKCATEGTIDVLRSKVEPFCDALSLEGKIKIVVLDELDSASTTGTNNFQMGLRTLIEAAQDDTRFLITANYSQKIIPAILSRCPIIPLKYNKKDLLIYVKKILDTKNIKYTRESLAAFIEENFCYYPDCRRIINYLQLCSNSGELTVKLNQAANIEKDSFLNDIASKIQTSSSVLDIRQFYISQKSKIDDFKTFGSDLFNQIVDRGLINDPRIILKMSDIIYQMNLVVNPEIQFFALVCLIQASLHSK